MYLRKKVSSQTGKIVQERKRAQDETLAKDFIDAEHLPYLGHQYKELDKLHVFLGWVALLVMSFIRLCILLNMALVLPFSLVIFPIYTIYCFVSRPGFWTAVQCLLAQAPSPEDPGYVPYTHRIFHPDNKDKEAEGWPMQFFGNKFVKKGEPLTWTLLPWEWKGIGQGWREFEDTALPLSHPDYDLAKSDTELETDATQSVFAVSNFKKSRRSQQNDTERESLVQQKKRSPFAV